MQFILTEESFHGAGGSYAGQWAGAMGHNTVQFTRESSVPVKLSSFTASSENGVVTLEWITESEVDNLGFHVYRALSERGPYEKITAERIQGAGSSATKHEYTFTDEGLTEGVTYWYRLEDVAFDGTRTMHGPISVDAEGVVSLPEEYVLPPCYPNPFNSITTIQYQLPESSDVRLAIYNVLGQEVRVLVEETQEAGQHTVHWDSRDDSGREMGSGIYLSRLQREQFSSTRRMLLLR